MYTFYNTNDLHSFSNGRCKELMVKPNSRNINITTTTYTNATVAEGKRSPFAFIKNSSLG